MRRKGKELTPGEKDVIVKLENESFSHRQIASMLGIPRTTMDSVLNKFHQTGSTENLKRSGRRGILGDRGKTALLRSVKKSRSAFQGCYKYI